MIAPADQGTPRRSPWRLVGAAAAFTAALAFGAGTLRLALHGTGAQLPTGDDVIEGVVADGPTVPSPVGLPFLYGRVALTVPEAAKPVGKRFGRMFWSETFGDPTVTIVDADGGRHRWSLPDPKIWQEAPTDYLAAASLAGKPLVADAPHWREHREQTGTIGIGVVAVRPGDAIIAGPKTLHFGTRAQLEGLYASREAMRWPIVGLLAIMGLVSLALGVKAIRRPTRAEDVTPGAPSA